MRYIFWPSYPRDFVLCFLSYFEFCYRLSPSCCICLIKERHSQRYGTHQLHSMSCVVCACVFVHLKPNCLNGEKTYWTMQQIELCTSITGWGHLAVTKLFQSSDAGLRRLVYLMIKELSPSSDEVRWCFSDGYKLISHLSDSKVFELHVCNRSS